MNYLGDVVTFACDLYLKSIRGVLLHSYLYVIFTLCLKCLKGNVEICKNL